MCPSWHKLFLNIWKLFQELISYSNCVRRIYLQKMNNAFSKVYVNVQTLHKPFSNLWNHEKLLELKWIICHYLRRKRQPKVSLRVLCECYVTNYVKFFMVYVQNAITDSCCKLKATETIEWRSDAMKETSIGMFIQLIVFYLLI